MLNSLKTVRFMLTFSWILIIPALVSCGDMSCPANKFLAPLRVQKGDDQMISELIEKIAEENRRDEKSRSMTRLAEFHDQLGTKYLDKRSWDPAVENLEKAIGLGRRTSAVHYSLGMAYANRGKDLGNAGDFNKAELHYRRSLDMMPDRNDAVYGIAVLYFYHMDRKSDAIDILEKAALKHRTYYLVRFGLARMYYDLQKPDRSLVLYQELCSDLNKQPDAGTFLEYKKACRENIQRLTLELSNKK
jgi:tetratricopeptide (TPR) repeat protein